MAPRAVFVAVSLCFFLSGFAALLYQMAWMRQLSVEFGTSELAVATILAAYMAGLALGAAIAARLMDRIRRPILVYGVLEATIALSAIGVPFLLQLAGVAYAWMFGGQPQPPDATGLGQSMFYLCVTFVVLAVPTACMAVKGLIVLRPDGYSIWESIKKSLDEKLQKIGVRNGFLPILIPESLLAKEKEHFAGLNPEVFWVTHSGDNELGDKLALRPTSETLAYSMYSKWIIGRHAVGHTLVGVGA